MEIFVDADACPVKEQIVRMARARGLSVTMVTDTSHELHDGYSTVITVDKARDSADIRLINLVHPGDIVVTQDFGVAAMAMARGARPVNQNGLLFSGSNIDALLLERHMSAKARRAGKRTPGFKKRTAADDAAFEEAFRNLLDAQV